MISGGETEIRASELPNSLHYSPDNPYADWMNGSTVYQDPELDILKSCCLHKTASKNSFEPQI